MRSGGSPAPGTGGDGGRTRRDVVTARHPQRWREEMAARGGAHAGTPGSKGLRLRRQLFPFDSCSLSCSRDKAMGGAEPSPETRHFPFRLAGFSGQGESSETGIPLFPPPLASEWRARRQAKGSPPQSRR